MRPQANIPDGEYNRERVLEYDLCSSDKNDPHYVRTFIYLGEGTVVRDSNGKPVNDGLIKHFWKMKGEKKYIPSEESSFLK